MFSFPLQQTLVYWAYPTIYMGAQLLTLHSVMARRGPSLSPSGIDETPRSTRYIIHRLRFFAEQCFWSHFALCTDISRKERLIWWGIIEGQNDAIAASFNDPRSGMNHFIWIAYLGYSLKNSLFPPLILRIQNESIFWFRYFFRFPSEFFLNGIPLFPGWNLGSLPRLNFLFKIKIYFDFVTFYVFLTFSECHSSISRVNFGNLTKTAFLYSRAWNGSSFIFYP